MIRYNSKFRLRWDLLICFLAVYNCFSIPLMVSFISNPILGLSIWEYILDLLFTFDLIFNFRTTYLNSKTGFEVVDWKKISI